VHLGLGHSVPARIFRIRATARRLPTGRQVGLQGGQVVLQTDGRKTQSRSFEQISSSWARRIGGSALGESSGAFLCAAAGDAAQISARQTKWALI
jgi:hypothetical protein